MGGENFAYTINEGRSETDTGTVVCNVEKVSFGSSESAGTDIFSADKTATDAGATETTINNPNATANQSLFVAVTSVANSPTKFWVWVDYTLD